MTNSTAAFDDLENLLDPGLGNGIDMRPTLLRVLTDLYLQRPSHTPEDERYFTELTLRLIDATDIAARASLAAKLATYPSAPHAVLMRLARDVIEVAAPVLTHSCTLTSAELSAIAQDCGAAHARAIAARPTPSATSPTARLPDPPASVEAYELSQLFYAAASPERRLILINLDYSMLAPSPPRTGLRRSDVRRLESAVLRHNAEALVRELESVLEVSRTQARRMVEDPLGEPIVVAARAMSLPPDVLQRILLFMNPCARQSVDRVHELTALYDEISVDAARRMVTIWCRAERTEGPPVRLESVAWRTAAENASRALSEVSRRSEFRHALAHQAR